MRSHGLSERPLPLATKQPVFAEDILKAAIGTLELGWGQGAMFLDRKGEPTHEGVHGCCLWGSVLWHTPKMPNEVLHALLVVIHKDYKHQSIASFNDAPGRTKAEVLDVARKALKMVQAEAGLR